VLTGSASGYGSDVAKALHPPEEIADRASSEEPITANIILERSLVTQGELWIYPGRLSQDPRALRAVTTTYDNYDQLHQGLYKSGLFDAGVSNFKLIVEGNRNVPVQIIGMRAVFNHRLERSTGHTALSPGPQGTGPLVQIGFDLDESDPLARAVNQEEGATIHVDGYFKQPFFSSSVTELKRGERQVYQVQARTIKWDLDWTVELEVVDGAGLSRRIPAKQNIRTIGILYDKESGPTSPDPAQYSEFYEFGLFAGVQELTFVRQK
ncbi:MAG TPA: hypothetical protein VJ742_04330, partial [Nitrososphaera sp.]|nr:hypothetical protein [Nitrososphaera sp.]